MFDPRTVVHSSSFNRISTFAIEISDFWQLQGLFTKLYIVFINGQREVFLSTFVCLARKFRRGTFNSGKMSSIWNLPSSSRHMECPQLWSYFLGLNFSKLKTRRNSTPVFLHRSSLLKHKNWILSWNALSVIMKSKKCVGWN
jgi:hypothetical protein